MLTDTAWASLIVPLVLQASVVTFLQRLKYWCVVDFFWLMRLVDFVVWVRDPQAFQLLAIRVVDGGKRRYHLSSLANNHELQESGKARSSDSSLWLGMQASMFQFVEVLSLCLPLALLNWLGCIGYVFRMVDGFDFCVFNSSQWLGMPFHVSL